MTTMTFNPIRNMALAVLASVSVLAFAAAPAEAAADPVRATVAVKAADAVSGEGRRAVDARIRAAAERVCGSADVRDLRAAADRKACVSAAVADGQLQLAAIATRFQVAAQ